ncbi:DUF397 domain-containing protein [Streptomyces syringium]|uniref:DUF397 domain-containing protein n=1 Tax=Streptomyces syringium TaxID=76729 RepID=UPI001A9180F7|nr:DUF397 domain-containing protein [Streptomyces syringium]
MGDQIFRPLWRRSTFSQGVDGNCVEIAFVHREVWVRDSNAPDRPALSFTHRPWQEFLARLVSPTG